MGMGTIQWFMEHTHKWGFEIESKINLLKKELKRKSNLNKKVKINIKTCDINWTRSWINWGDWMPVDETKKRKKLCTKKIERKNDG